VKVAAYQAALGLSVVDAIDAVRDAIRECEAQNVASLCCPEGVLGGLADYVRRPSSLAINSASGELDRLLAPLASPTVTTILGFTETDGSGDLFNSAAVIHVGKVTAVYRKLYPAIHRSIYQPGQHLTTFTAGTFTCGVLICRDSTYDDPATRLASQGARAFFIPTNNGMPPERGRAELVSEARRLDVHRARALRVAVIRADVVGEAGSLVSHGATSIVNHRGTILGTSIFQRPELVVADLDLDASGSEWPPGVPNPRAVGAAFAGCGLCERDNWRIPDASGVS
jgi:predicted amidohydrolase